MKSQIRRRLLSVCILLEVGLQRTAMPVSLWAAKGGGLEHAKALTYQLRPV